MGIKSVNDIYAKYAGLRLKFQTLSDNATKWFWNLKVWIFLKI